MSPEISMPLTLHKSMRNHWLKLQKNINTTLFGAPGRCLGGLKIKCGIKCSDGKVESITPNDDGSYTVTYTFTYTPQVTEAHDG